MTHLEPPGCDGVVGPRARWGVGATVIRAGLARESLLQHVVADGRRRAVVVLAETIKMDTSEVLLILVVVLGTLAAVMGWVAVVAVAMGLKIGRLQWERETDPTPLIRGSRWSLAIGGFVATIASWLLLWWSLGSLVSGGGELLLGLGAGFPLPILWGWWHGCRHFYGTVPPLHPSDIGSGQ